METPPAWLTDWSQIIGAGLSVVALIVAFIALVKAKYDLADERRRQHDLELLRGIAELLELQLFAPFDERLEIKAKIASRLLLLPRTDMPTVRAAISAASTPEQDEIFHHRMESFLRSSEGREHVDETLRDSPNTAREDAIKTTISYDAPRWKFVTRHMYEEGVNHVYGYTHNSIALQELRTAIAARIEHNRRRRR